VTVTTRNVHKTCQILKKQFEYVWLK
jgi:hypothetical protein